MAAAKAKKLTPKQPETGSEGAQKSKDNRSRYRNYQGFTAVDGYHPWQTQVPEGYVGYQVRELRTGKVLYFNFQLAKEMGLISAVHPHEINRDLEQMLLKTFSIRIINEHDEIVRRRYPPDSKKPNQYMATRYLQLQHPNKQGRTSGDGRSIWNGIIKSRGQVWDISSRGTGVTRLSPGSVLAGKPLASGDYSVGYGCGTADIDELLGAAIMSEVYHCQGIKTERTLAIIDLDGTVGIGVRAAPNLLRPAHLFMHLKQNNLSATKRAADYLIERQVDNKEWSLVPNKNKYWQMARHISREFAWFAARLDVDYIFAWFDWDGDNVLANAAIIDYGSIRQFGLRHDQYRYDDIERFSTNLNEQRQKTRLIVQTFAQLADFIVRGQRRPLDKFRNHPIVKQFDMEFSKAITYWRLYRMGLEERQIKAVLSKKRPWLQQLMKDYNYLERKKTHRSLFQVADGVHRPAILNMRHLLRSLAEKAAASNQTSNSFMTAREMFNLILTPSAKGKDKRFTPVVSKRLSRFEHNYRALLASVFNSPQELSNGLRRLHKRASIINRPDRMTGNGIENVVHTLLQAYKKGSAASEIQKILEALIVDQILTPDAKPRVVTVEPPQEKALLSQLLTLLEDFQDDI